MDHFHGLRWFFEDFRSKWAKVFIFGQMVMNALGIACIDLEINVLSFVFSKFVDFLFLFFVWCCYAFSESY